MLHFLSNLDNQKIDAFIIGAGYEGSCSFRSGCQHAPRKIINAFENNMEIFDMFTRNEPYNIFEYGFFELDSVNQLTSEAAIDLIHKTLNKTLDKFTLLLGGSHGVSNAYFLFLSKLHKPEDVTILQIDAHPDLRDNTDDYKPGSSKFDHACVMRRACELGFRIVQVGIRTISIYDWEMMQKSIIKTFEWNKFPRPSISEIVSSISTEKVYLTLDVDGLDPCHAPATGTPIPGGLDIHYAQELIRSLIMNKTLVGADIVEVAPFADDVLTEYTAALLSYNIVSYALLKKNGALQFH